MTLKDRMTFMDKLQQTSIQAKAFDFALTELVRSHRESFQPLWSVDSWVKFLIWMALNCGLSGEQASLELFAESFGPVLTRRMRKIFFERNLDQFSLCVMADPSESNILLIPLEGGSSIQFADAAKALITIGLNNVIEQNQEIWKLNDGIITIPWKSSERES